jgi:DNA-binding GntR family transcriptional regulator
MSSLKPLIRRSTEDQALNLLRDYILSDPAPSSRRLTEMRLSEALLISRATVRTALHRLTAEGLVVQTPYSGWHIAVLSSHDIWELYELRASMEALAARLAAKFMDDEGRRILLRLGDQLNEACANGYSSHIAECDFAFHQAVIDQARNAKLREHYRLIEQQVRLFITSSNALIEKPGDIELQHRPLLEALLVSDGDLASRLFEQHTLTEGRKLEAAVRAQEAHH